MAYQIRSVLLTLRCYPWKYFQIQRIKNSLEKLKAKANSERQLKWRRSINNVYWVYSNQQRVGFFEAWKEYDSLSCARTTRIYLHGLYIHPNHQRGGAGRFVIQRLISKGIPFYLRTMVGNSGIEGLCKGEGFSSVVEGGLTEYRWNWPQA